MQRTKNILKLAISLLVFLQPISATEIIRRQVGCDAIKKISPPTKESFTHAIMDGCLDHVEKGVRSGINGNDINTYDLPYWLSAIRHGKSDIALFLFENGANINDNFYSWTPLLEAVSTGDLIVARYLLAHGGKVNVETDDQRTPLDIALISNHIELFRLLIANGAKVHPEMMTATDEPEIIQILLLHKIDINTKSPGGETALFDVVIRDYEIVDSVHGLARTKNEQEARRLRWLKFLLAHGADPNVKAKNGKTVLMLARESKNAEIEKILLAAGAKE